MSDNRKISIIHPSRGRPSRAYDAFQILRQNASSPFEYILSIEANDPDTQKYLDLFENAEGVTLIVKADHGCMTAGLQNGATCATGDILCGFFDDFSNMPAGWNDMILNATRGREFWALKTNDGVPLHWWIHSFPIMDRKFFEWYGALYLTRFNHMFADNALAAAADLLGCCINASKTILFRQYHHSITHDEVHQKDAINEMNDAHWNHDEAVYIDLFQRNFDIPKHMIKGRIKDSHQSNFVRKKLRERAQV